MDVLDECMESSLPVDSLVLVETLILGNHKSLLEKWRDMVQGYVVVDIPAVLIGYGERDVMTIQYLHLAEIGTTQGEGVG